ncbi:MAG: PEP-CTERM sorting domain-containing protein [Rhodocyclaceae bacterium]|nr:MAG: PEP-CTERM sorting domain-containing protein [Rhodocyclaceae bacterium]
MPVVRRVSTNPGRKFLVGCEMSKYVFGSLALGLALIATAPVQAASSWSFTTGGTEANANSFGNTRTYSAGTNQNVTISAWSDTKNSGSGANTVTNAYIQNAYLGSYSGGLGVTNRDGATGAGDTNEGTIANTSVPGHTMDNSVRYDSMLFDFGTGKSVALNSVTVGWWYSDSDITVLAYTGTGTPTFVSANQGYASLLSSGWSVVKASAGTTGTANYSNAAGNTPQQSSDASKYVPLAVNDLNVSARYWLVGALNNLVQALPNGATVNAGNDYVKIAAISATYKTPEPSSMVLASGALAGIMLMRRRRKN